MPIQDILQQIITHLRGVWRYRWYTMIVAWVIAISGWVYIMGLDDQYSANAKIIVNTDSSLRPLLSGLAITTNVSQRVKAMTRRLLTNPILEKVIRRTDLDLLVRDSASMNKMIRKLRKSIRIKAGRRNNVYSISAEYGDPIIVKSIVQELVEIFVEETLSASRTDSSSAQSFLEKQIKGYELKLRAAEDRRKEFNRKYAGRVSNSASGYFQQLQSETTRYESALLDLKEVEFKRDELKSQMQGEVPLFGILPNSVEEQRSPHRLDAKIQVMQNDLDALLLQYTEQHPKIISLKERIDDQTTIRVKELAVLPKRRKRLEMIDKNPVYQQLKIEYGRAEAQVSVLKVRVQGYKKRLDKVQGLADTVPRIESELNELNRDYQLNKRNYDTLIARLESSIMGDAAEKTGEDIKFEVIERPTVPTKPFGPKRALLSTGAIAFGIIAGLALAFLMSQIRPTFYDQRTLRQVTGLPVFGSVSRVWTPQLLVKKRLEFGGFVSVGLVLCVMLFGVIFIGSSAPELKQQVSNTVKAISK